MTTIKKSCKFLALSILLCISITGCKNSSVLANINHDNPANSTNIIKGHEILGEKDSNFVNDGKENTENYPNMNNIPSPPPAPPIYKIGNNGQAIEAIQNRLKIYGYNITPDGNFGQNTLNAIKDFQSRLGLAVDGTVGEITMEKLNEEPTAETKYVPISYDKFNSKDTADKELFMNENSLSSATKYFITVSLSNHEVNVFEGSFKNWRLIKTFICSTGKPSTPTIKGTFTIGTRGKSFGQDEGFMCKYFTQISGNYLFHSTVFNLDGSNSDSRLGLSISHGCIRLEENNAKWIYDNITADTKVIIR